MQAAGRCKTLQYPSLRTIMRSIVHVLHERHSPAALYWHHVKAHADHPWNELVDRLAKHASVMGHIPNCEPWMTWMRKPDTFLALGTLSLMMALNYKEICYITASPPSSATIRSCPTEKKIGTFGDLPSLSDQDLGCHHQCFVTSMPCRRTPTSCDSTVYLAAAIS